MPPWEGKSPQKTIWSITQSETRCFHQPLVRIIYVYCNSKQEEELLLRPGNGKWNLGERYLKPAFTPNLSVFPRPLLPPLSTLFLYFFHLLLFCSHYPWEGSITVTATCTCLETLQNIGPHGNPCKAITLLWCKPLKLCISVAQLNKELDNIVLQMHLPNFMYEQ